MGISKILIINPGGIGDAIMFTPALRVLRENFSEAKIDFFAIFTPASSQIFVEGRMVNKIYNFDWSKSSFFEKLKFIQKLRKEKYDLSVMPTEVNPLLGGLLSYLIGAKSRVGEYRKFKTPFYTHQAKVDRKEHKIFSDRNLVKALGLKAEKVPAPIFELRQEDEQFAEEIISRIGAKDKIVIGFHPGAGENLQFKIWPKENFIKLGKIILEKRKDVCLILFGGPKEEEICQEIKEKIGGNVFLATEFSLKQAAALIGKCKIFVSSDSGLSHIASTTSAEIIAIFGPTNPERTGPFGEKVHIIKEKCGYATDGFNMKKYNTKRVHTCLGKITPERVFSEIEKLMF